MNIYNEMNNIADAFRGRFISESIKEQVGYDVATFAKDYVHHNEVALAFELICDQLYEYDVPFTRDEYKRIEILGKFLFPEGNKKILRLQSLLIENY